MSAHDLSESQTTFPSDSENYDANNSNSPGSSEEPPSVGSSPMILYSPPTFWSILRGAAINLLLPFVNGLMLGFGELFAHEAAFRLGWSKTKVRVSIHTGQATGFAALYALARYSQHIIVTYAFCRFFPPTVTRDLLGRAWRYETTRSNEEGGVEESWICILHWSELYGTYNVQKVPLCKTRRSKAYSKGIAGASFQGEEVWQGTQLEPPQPPYSPPED